MTRCCAKCLWPVSIDEGQAYVNGKVLHLQCIEYHNGNINAPHGPLATDDIERDGNRITLWREGRGYNWSKQYDY